MSKYKPLGLDVPTDEIADKVPLLRFFGIRDAKLVGDAVVAEMPITEACLNLQRTPHGGAISSLIDYSSAMACAHFAGVRASTADFQIRFLAGSAGTVLRAESRLVRAGKRLVVIETRVLDDHDVLIAMASVALAPFPVL